LSKYIPYVDKCSGSSILKTRSLAASAMVALITPNIFVDHLINVFHNISSSTSENLTHGLLLQVNVLEITLSLLNSIIELINLIKDFF
jgi:hypothetical protein